MVNRKVKKTALCVFLSLLIASTIGVTASAKPNEVGLAFSDGTVESTVQESSADDGAGAESTESKVDDGTEAESTESKADDGTEAESTESKADDGTEAERTESKAEDSNSGENDGASEVVVTEQESEVSLFVSVKNIKNVSKQNLL